MQQDTRNLTVALDHLHSAGEEIALAQSHLEASMAHAAVRRALDHLGLVTRRLEQERALADRGRIGVLVERASSASRQAWQSAHDLLNSGAGYLGSRALPLRDQLDEARSALEAACLEAEGLPRVHG